MLSPNRLRALVDFHTMAKHPFDATSASAILPASRSAMARDHRSRRHYPVLYRSMRILEGISAFLLLLSIIVLSMYLLGNYQQFLPESQLLLLGILRVISGLCAFASLYYGVALVIWMISRRHLLPGRLVYAVAALSFAVTVSLSAHLVTVLIQPVS